MKGFVVTNLLVENWPIILFILIQLIGSYKILVNMKTSDAEMKGELELTKVEIKGELQVTTLKIEALEKQFIKQNGRVTKMEDRLTQHLEIPIK